MSTSLIALNNYRALLYTTLDSYEVLEFVEYAITKRMMSHLERDKIIEAQTTTKKIDSFIRAIGNDGALINAFLEWLLETNKSELHQRITESAVQGVESQFGQGDDESSGSDGESDCESLSSTTQPVLNTVSMRVSPTQQFIDSKLADTCHAYDVTRPPGVALIIANRKFDGAVERHATDLDTDHLSQLLSWLGYRVNIRSDATKEDFVSAIMEETRNQHTAHQQHGSFVLCILSHGTSDLVETSDNQVIYVQEIIELLDSNNFPAMAGKPKLLFLDLDSRRKPMRDHGVRVPIRTEPLHLVSPPRQPVTVASGDQAEHLVKLTSASRDQAIIINLNRTACKSHFVICTAAFPGYSAFHNRKIGSVATRVFVEVLSKHAHRLHILDLLFKVRRKLAIIRLAGFHQVVTVTDTLTKDFYVFPPPH